MKKIGVMTTGGDCAGLNAAIRAIVCRGIRGYGAEVVGIRYGAEGVYQNPMPLVTFDLTMDGWGETLLKRGGTILGSSTTLDPFRVLMDNGERQDLSDLFIKNINSLGLEALIVMGGDGSLKLLSALKAKGGLNLLAIPKTIDNDLARTDTSLGFSSAVRVATGAVDDIRTTAQSHRRVLVLEVMGRDAGHIALMSGIAGGADLILIPEIPYSWDGICSKIKEIESQKGKDFYATVVVAESVKTQEDGATTPASSKNKGHYGGIGSYIAEQIEIRTGHIARSTALGHLQRGVEADYEDRLLGTLMGSYAVDLVFQKKFGCMVTWTHGQVGHVSIEEAVSCYKGVDTKGCYVQAARAVGISFGDGQGAQAVAPSHGDRKSYS